MFKRIGIRSAALLLLAGLLIGCASPEPGGTTSLPQLTTPATTASSPATSDVTTQTPVTTDDPVTTETTTTAETIETAEPTVEPSEPTVDRGYTAEILAVGDNLFHTPLITAGEALGYDRLYDGIRDMISAADLAIINQETVFSKSGYSGYPKFATPTAVGDAAIAAGFDVFTCASNHTWDMGEQGILDTLEYFSAHPEVMEVGLNNDKNERNQLDIVEVNGISIAIFNFGTLINTKSTVWWRANYLDKTENTKSWVAGQIAKAKKQADFVIVCAHWGSEYVYTPTAQETYWAQFFADCEVDLVIGGHPHVVQPVQEIEGESGHKTLVYYSLGNFLHNQNDMNANVGGMAKIRLYKDEEGNVSIVDYDLLATTVDCQVVDGINCYTPRLLSDMTDEMLKTSWKWGSKEVTVADFEAIFMEAIASYPNQTPTET